MLSRFRRAALWAACVGVFAVPGSAFALKPLDPSPVLTFGVAEPEALLERSDGQYAPDGRVVSWYQPAFRARRGDAEAMARQFLAERHAQLGLTADEAEKLEVGYRRDNAHFSVVRFVQKRMGLPVYGSDIAVSVKRNGEVIYVTNDALPNLADPQVSVAAKTSDEAIARAKNHLRVSRLLQPEAEQVIYAANGKTYLAWRVQTRAEGVRGTWEVLVDAANGDVLRAEDKAVYSHAEQRGGEPQAWVWSPDPVSSAKVAYGGGYVDGNNADTPQLTAELKTVTLEDLTFSGGVYRLQSQWVVCDDSYESPVTAGTCPTSATGEFFFTRSAVGFDGVMGYYHLNTMMKYVNETLGVEAMPINHSGGVRFDPHGEYGDDNSHFSSACECLSFGEGGVDDAQDADVLVHELGHAMHYFVTGGHLSQTQGLSEGTGDYQIASYSRSFTDQWAPSDPAYYWSFSWDGHNEYWSGRVLNYQTSRTYANIGTQIHTAGQYWASCNARAHDLLGREVMDKAFWEGLSMTGSNTNQKAAAQAIINAAAALGYSQSQIDTLSMVYNAGTGSDYNCTYAVTVPTAQVPEIDVGSNAIEETALGGESIDVPFTLSNVGGGTLNWTISASSDLSCAAPPPAPALSWVWATPSSGSIASGGNASVTVTLDASSTPVGGVNTATLCVYSNDAETPVVAVPVTFTVVLMPEIFRDGFEEAPAP